MRIDPTLSTHTRPPLVMAASPPFPGPNAALIGYTGYVGSNLHQHASSPPYHPYKALFNSSNIDQIQEALSNADNAIDTVVCAGAPGFKLGANTLGQDLSGKKYDDTAAMDKLIADLDRIQVGVSNVPNGANLEKKKKLFILISTLSVYSVCSHEEASNLHRANTSKDPEYYSRHGLSRDDALSLNEARDVWTRPGPLSDGGLSDSTYGQNRSRLEAFVKQKFNPQTTDWDYLLVRLPGIFGVNMRKNYIFDLLTKSPWRHKINLNTLHQWYPLRLLSEDIGKVVAYNNNKIGSNESESGASAFGEGDGKLRIVNLFPEPLKTEKIVDTLFPEQREEVPDMRNPEECFVDGVETREGKKLWWVPGEERREIDGYKPMWRISKERSLQELEEFKREFEAGRGVWKAG